MPRVYSPRNIPFRHCFPSFIINCHRALVCVVSFGYYLKADSPQATAFHLEEDTPSETINTWILSVLNIKYDITNSEFSNTLNNKYIEYDIYQLTICYISQSCITTQSYNGASLCWVTHTGIHIKWRMMGVSGAWLNNNILDSRQLIPVSNCLTYIMEHKSSSQAVAELWTRCRPTNNIYF